MYLDQMICQFEQTKNGNKLAIMNLIQKKFHRMYGSIVVNACVENQEDMFICVGGIHPDGQVFKIFCEFEQTIMNLILTKIHRIHRIEINACVKYGKKLVLGILVFCRTKFSNILSIGQTKMEISQPLC